MTTQEKLDLLKQTKANIKAAIIAKGVDVSDTDTFASFATKIAEINSDSSYYNMFKDLCLINNRLKLNYLLNGRHVTQEMINAFSSLCAEYYVLNMTSMTSNRTNFDDNLSFPASTVINIIPSYTNDILNCFNYCKVAGEITMNVLEASMDNLNLNTSFIHSSLSKIHFSGTVSKIKTIESAFESCEELEEITGLDFTNVTTIARTFNNCKKLKAIDFSTLTNKCIAANDCLKNCTALESITNMNITNITGTISLQGNAKLQKFTLQSTETKSSDIIIDISGTMQTKNGVTSKDPILEMFNSLPTASGTAKLLIASAILSQLTSDELAIATAKGWTVEAGNGWIVT